MRLRGSYRCCAMGRQGFCVSVARRYVHRNQGQVSGLRDGHGHAQDKMHRRKHELRNGARKQKRPPPSTISIHLVPPAQPEAAPTVRIYTVRSMWSTEAVIARHECAVMEEEREAAAASSAVPEAAEAHDGTKAAATMKVVAAVDASEESLHALSWALDNIVGLHPGASVVVVHSQHRVDHVVYPVAAHAVAYAPTTAIDTMRKTQEENSRKIVARALDICSQKQVSATAAVVEGDAKEAICQGVEDMHADLLVLGSRGLGMIKRALLGSVSDYLAHHACCPVLVVKPSKAHDK